MGGSVWLLRVKILPIWALHIDFYLFDPYMQKYYLFDSYTWYFTYFTLTQIFLTWIFFTHLSITSFALPKIHFHKSILHTCLLPQKILPKNLLHNFFITYYFLPNFPYMKISDLSKIYQTVFQPFFLLKRGNTILNKKGKTRLAAQITLINFLIPFPLAFVFVMHYTCSLFQNLSLY